MMPIMVYITGVVCVIGSIVTSSKLNIRKSLFKTDKIHQTSRTPNMYLCFARLFSVSY